MIIFKTSQRNNKNDFHINAMNNMKGQVIRVKKMDSTGFYNDELIIQVAN